MEYFKALTRQLKRYEIKLLFVRIIGHANFLKGLLLISLSLFIFHYVNECDNYLSNKYIII